MKKAEFQPITDFRLGYLLSLADSSGVIEPTGIESHIVKELIQNVLFWREDAITHHGFVESMDHTQCDKVNCAILRTRADQSATFTDAPYGVFDDEDAEGQ